MPGMNKTNSFMLGTATVMVGPREKLYDLTPAESIGLVKNFTLSSEPSYVELTAGRRNTLVDSQMNGNPVRASMEAYEYTAQNFTYALGLDGSGISEKTETSTVATEVVGGASQTEIPVATGDGSVFAEGDFIFVDIDGDDSVLIRRIVSIETDTLTVDRTIPTGTTIPVGAIVKTVHAIDIGSKDNQPYLAAKVIGRLTDDTPVGLLIPKIRITRGFSLAFGSDDYGNLPFEMSVFDLAASDVFYSDFRKAPAKLFRT